MTDHTHVPKSKPEQGSDQSKPEQGSERDPTADDSDVEADDPMMIHPDEVDRTFDWRGWSLVGAVFVAFLVVPGFIYVYPRIPSNVGLSFWDAYLVLPMLPAVVLGALAVWATTRP